MANHCYAHFKNKITIEQVQEHIQFYCAERLGNESLVHREGDYISVKVPRDNSKYETYASYWLANSRKLEHRHIHEFTFGVNIMDYVAWKMKATHCSDEGLSQNISFNNFLSKPTIEFFPTHESFGLPMPMKLLKNVLAVKEKSKYENENKFIQPINNLSSFFYIEDKSQHRQDYSIKMAKEYDARLHEILKKSKDEQNDCFYGDPLHAALANSNFKLACDLINNNFKVVDELDLSTFKKPRYISKKYLQDISMPLLNICINSIEKNCNPEDIYETMTALIQHGANPFAKDSRGMDSLDCFFLNRVANKKQSEMIFKAFRYHLKNQDLKDKISESNLSLQKKDFFMAEIKTFNSTIKPK